MIPDGPAAAVAKHVHARRRTRRAPEDIRVRRSWLSVFPTLLVAAVAVYAVREISQTMTLPPVDLAFSFGKDVWELRLPIYLLIGLILAARPLFLMGDTKHIVGKHHVYSELGRMSFGREHIELAYEEMLGVRFRQSLFERVLNVGSVFIWTASADHPEIVMRGIYNPEKLVHIIRGRIDAIITDGKMARRTVSNVAP